MHAAHFHVTCQIVPAFNAGRTGKRVLTAKPATKTTKS